MKFAICYLCHDYMYFITWIMSYFTGKEQQHIGLKDGMHPFSHHLLFLSESSNPGDILHVKKKRNSK